MLNQLNAIFAQNSALSKGSVGHRLWQRIYFRGILQRCYGTMYRRNINTQTIFNRTIFGDNSFEFIYLSRIPFAHGFSMRSHNIKMREMCLPFFPLCLTFENVSKLLNMCLNKSKSLRFVIYKS